MADNVTFQDGTLATPPDNTVVATDDVGGAHYQRMKLVDGTDGGSTGAKVTSEGNLQTITPNRTASGTLDALDEAVTIATDGGGIARFQFTASTFVSGCRVVLEGSSDGGTTWTGLQLTYQNGGFHAIASEWVQPVEGDELSAPVGGLTHARIRVSLYDTGSADVTASVGAGEPPVHAIAVYDGDGNIVRTGGGTEAQALRVTVASDSTGVLSVDDNGASLTVDGTVTAAAQPGVDIGDVTVNNAAGAAAVNIQDGGNSITVDGTVTATVSGVSTLAEQQSQTTHLATIAGDTTDIEAAVELIDDTVYTDDTSTHSTGSSKGLLFMAAATPTDASVNANDIGAVAMTTDRKLHVAVQDAIPAGNNNIGDVDVASVTGNVTVIQGTATNLKAQAEAYQGGSAVAAGNPLQVTLANGSVPSHAVTNAGTFATQVDGSALTALQLIDDPVFADEASFTTATSKVGVMGVKTTTSGSAPDDAGGADRAVSAIANRNRVQYVIGGDPGVITVKHTNITTAVTDAAIVTVSTGNKIVVTRLTVTLDNASTVFPTCVIGFGTANTPTTTGVLFAHGGVPAGGGATIGDGSGILGIGADNEDLRVTTTGNATGNGLQITVSYFLVVA